MEPMMWVAIAALVIAAMGVVHSTVDLILHIRAERRFVRVLAESVEYRPLIGVLKTRVEKQGALEIGEHEAIDLRHRVAQAMDLLPRGDRRRVGSHLYSPTVRGREFYLHKVLYKSIDRLEQHA
jgi:hypothetical protein